MTRITIAAAALLAFTGVAQADICSNLAWQIEANGNAVQREGNEIASNSAMMTASAQAGDVTMAKLYARMGRDTAIRMIGLATEARNLVLEVDKQPGNCGASDADVKEFLKSADDFEKLARDSIAQYNKTFN